MEFATVQDCRLVRGLVGGVGSFWSLGGCGDVGLAWRGFGPFVGLVIRMWAVGVERWGVECEAGLGVC